MKHKIYTPIYLLITFSLLLMANISYGASSAITPCAKNAAYYQQYYPHWNLNDANACKVLTQVDKLIKKYAGKGYLATFDWDGTIFSENIDFSKYGVKAPDAGEVGWHIWAAYHLNDPLYPNLLPTFQTKDGQAKAEILEFVTYLDGRSNVIPTGYNKFSQEATIETGMTVRQLDKGLSGFLAEYQPKNYAFYPMLDVMQHMVDRGFKVWIITGSNPYILAPIIQNIEKNLYYKTGKHYKFYLAPNPYNIATGHIVGNAAKLKADGTFSRVYDDRFLKAREPDLYIVDEKGKALAIQDYVEKVDPEPVVFCAGNSGGDVEMIKYVLGKPGQYPNHMCLAVNPRGTLPKLLKVYSNLLEVSEAPNM